jgi:hypothetical protein
MTGLKISRKNYMLLMMKNPARIVMMRMMGLTLAIRKNPARDRVGLTPPIPKNPALIIGCKSKMTSLKISRKNSRLTLPILKNPALTMMTLMIGLNKCKSTLPILKNLALIMMRGLTLPIPMMALVVVIVLLTSLALYRVGLTLMGPSQNPNPGSVVVFHVICVLMWLVMVSIFGVIKRVIIDRDVRNVSYVMLNFHIMFDIWII